MMTSWNGNIFRVTGPFWRDSIVHRWIPLKMPVTRSHMYDVFFDVRLNKWLSKHSRHRGFETPWCSLWRHCNDSVYAYNKLAPHYMSTLDHSRIDSYLLNSVYDKLEYSPRRCQCQWMKQTQWLYIRFIKLLLKSVAVICMLQMVRRRINYQRFPHLKYMIITSYFVTCFKIINANSTQIHIVGHSKLILPNARDLHKNTQQDNNTVPISLPSTCDPCVEPNLGPVELKSIMRNNTCTEKNIKFDMFEIKWNQN